MRQRGYHSLRLVTGGYHMPRSLLEFSEALPEAEVVPHPVFPDSQGPAARRIEDDADVRDVIELLRLNYDRAVARHGLPEPGTAEQTTPLA